MIFHVLTIFPDLVQPLFEHGILRRALQSGIIGAAVRDLRDWTDDIHRTTDDSPYGGGPGMVMLCDPIYRAVEELRSTHGPLPLCCLSPAGERFTHDTACELAEGGDFILLCGRYEGIDQRVLDNLVDREFCLGDYVLSGGEIAAMAVIDAVARQIPGVVGNEDSVPQESFASGLLDYPHYTRPEEYRGLSVPDILLSGHHANVEKWRLNQALKLTYRRRPDLLTPEQLNEARRLIELEDDEA